MDIRHLTLFFLLFSCILQAQENLSSLSISKDLKENANVVIRSSTTHIEIASRKSMTITKANVVTVFNETGLRSVDVSEYFDNSTEVQSIEAYVYDAYGQEIKKIKRKDFKVSSLSEGSEVTEGKVMYLDYTPVTYPFTIVYNSEVQTANTAFIPSWMPIQDLYVSVESASLSIQYEPELGFRFKDYNFEGYDLAKDEKPGFLLLSVKNISAFKNEDYTPYQKILPVTLFSLDKFHLEGVDGEANDWATFGAWVYNTLLNGTDELPQETKDRVKTLVANETDPVKKAKIIYEYVQSKTRYVSIQLGIGGWKPMKAKDVDRLGYGDCKALTNYTRVLLREAGVNSYYAIVYGDNEKRDIREDFVSMQGNHVILCMPHDDKMIWLECTSQTAPFGFQGDFTDDRLALLVKPEGSELVRTHVYNLEQNTQISKGSYSVSVDGVLKGSVQVMSKGTQYDFKYFLEKKSKEDIDKFYKSVYRNINNLKINAELTNEKDTQQFIESIDMEASGYGSMSGIRMMFAVNAFNQYDNIPQRYRNRNNPFEISRGFYDTDEITISLPDGFAIEALPTAVILNEKFGEYKAEYIKSGSHTILYKRSLVIKNGYYEKSDYEAFRLFRENIARNDNAKIVLIKN